MIMTVLRVGSWVSVTAHPTTAGPERANENTRPGASLPAGRIRMPRLARPRRVRFSPAAAARQEPSADNAGEAITTTRYHPTGRTLADPGRQTKDLTGDGHSPVRPRLSQSARILTE